MLWNIENVFARYVCVASLISPVEFTGLPPIRGNFENFFQCREIREKQCFEPKSEKKILESGNQIDK